MKKCNQHFNTNSQCFHKIFYFIHISLSECYYIFNYKDHWDPGLLYMFTHYLINCQMVLYILTGYRVLGIVSWLAIGCSALYFLTSYRVLIIHTYLITILWVQLNCSWYFFKFLNFWHLCMQQSSLHWVEFMFFVSIFLHWSIFRLYLLILPRSLFHY